MAKKVEEMEKKQINEEKKHYNAGLVGEEGHKAHEVLQPLMRIKSKPRHGRGNESVDVTGGYIIFYKVLHCFTIQLIEFWL